MNEIFRDEGRYTLGRPWGTIILLRILHFDAFRYAFFALFPEALYQDFAPDIQSLLFADSQGRLPWFSSGKPGWTLQDTCRKLAPVDGVPRVSFDAYIAATENSTGATGGVLATDISHPDSTSDNATTLALSNADPTIRSLLSAPALAQKLEPPTLANAAEISVQQNQEDKPGLKKLKNILKNALQSCSELSCTETWNEDQASVERDAMNAALSDLNEWGIAAEISRDNIRRSFTKIQQNIAQQSVLRALLMIVAVSLNAVFRGLDTFMPRKVQTQRRGKLRGVDRTVALDRTARWYTAAWYTVSPCLIFAKSGMYETRSGFEWPAMCEASEWKAQHIKGIIPPGDHELLPDEFFELEHLIRSAVRYLVLHACVMPWSQFEQLFDEVSRDLISRFGQLGTSYRQSFTLGKRTRSLRDGGDILGKRPRHGDPNESPAPIEHASAQISRETREDSVVQQMSSLQLEAPAPLQQPAAAFWIPIDGTAEADEDDDQSDSGVDDDTETLALQQQLSAFSQGPADAVPDLGLFPSPPSQPVTTSALPTNAHASNHLPVPAIAQQPGLVIDTSSVPDSAQFGDLLDSLGISGEMVWPRVRGRREADIATASASGGSVPAPDFAWSDPNLAHCLGGASLIDDGTVEFIQRALSSPRFIAAAAGGSARGQNDGEHNLGPAVDVVGNPSVSNGDIQMGLVRPEAPISFDLDFGALLEAFGCMTPQVAEDAQQGHVDLPSGNGQGSRSQPVPPFSASDMSTTPALAFPVDDARAPLQPPTQSLGDYASTTSSTTGSSDSSNKPVADGEASPTLPFSDDQQYPSPLSSPGPEPLRPHDPTPRPLGDQLDKPDDGPAPPEPPVPSEDDQRKGEVDGVDPASSNPIPAPPKPTTRPAKKRAVKDREPRSNSKKRRSGQSAKSSNAKRGGQTRKRKRKQPDPPEEEDNDEDEEGEEDQESDTQIARLRRPRPTWSIAKPLPESWSVGRAPSKVLMLRNIEDVDVYGRDGQEAAAALGSANTELLCEDGPGCQHGICFIHPVGVDPFWDARSPQERFKIQQYRSTIVANISSPIVIRKMRPTDHACEDDPCLTCSSSSAATEDQFAHRVLQVHGSPYAIVEAQVVDVCSDDPNEGKQSNTADGTETLYTMTLAEVVDYLKHTSTGGLNVLSGVMAAATREVEVIRRLTCNFAKAAELAHMDRLPPIWHQGLNFWMLGGYGAYSNAHVDANGLHTAVTIEEGEKIWVFKMLKVQPPKDDFRDLAVNEFDIVAVRLREGDTLIMPPGMIHEVLTTKNCVATGGHFIAAPTLKNTLVWSLRLAGSLWDATNQTHNDEVLSIFGACLVEALLPFYDELKFFDKKQQPSKAAVAILASHAPLLTSELTLWLVGIILSHHIFPLDEDRDEQPGFFERNSRHLRLRARALGFIRWVNAVKDDYSFACTVWAAAWDVFEEAKHGCVLTTQFEQDELFKHLDDMLLTDESDGWLTK